MKKIALISLLSIGCFIKVDAQNYGSFASGVFITKNGAFTGYNVTGSTANQIGTAPFSGDLGSFQQNSGVLTLNGAETKTYKQNWANVCGTTLYYSVHPTGETGAYNTLNLPYKAGCNSGTFSDGLGSCGGNDQKWSTIGSSIDLTNHCPGNYTLDIYYQLPGSNNNNYDCGDNQLIGSAASPAGSMTFTIEGTAPTVTVGSTKCHSGTAILTASNYTGEITWSNGQTGSSITAPVGSYTATSSLNGCTSPKSAVAVVEPCAVSCPANGNLLVNGSFEEGVLPSGEGWAGIDQPGWKELAPGNGGLIETWEHLYAGGESLEGNQYIELNYLALGTIAQDVRVVANQPMTLSFYHRARHWGYNESVRVDVVDLTTDQTIHSFMSDVMSDWTQFVTTFTPTSDDIEIRFVSLNASRNENDYSRGNFLDNVVLTYNSCLCGAPVSINGDTSVCQGSFSILTVNGCVGGNISWVFNGEGDAYPSTTVFGLPGVSYVASCNMPGCADTVSSPSVTVNCDEAQRGTHTIAISNGAAGLVVAPNPVLDAATIQLTGFNNGPVTLGVSSVNGAMMKTLKLDYVNGMTLPLDMSTLGAGMYFIKVQQGDKVAVAKVIKK